jgi:nucleoside-diphosphate-sugar epimerase
MRVFVTGATGFIGVPTVKELISAGHEVLGLARSDEGAKSLAELGAKVQRGSLADTDGLKEGASATDGVIHLGFIHDFSKFVENCEVDKRAIEAMGSVLADSKKPLIVTGGLAGIGAPGQLATENDAISPNFPFPRVSEQTALALKGVNASVMRLPQVHNTVKQGLVSYMIPGMREKGVAGYVGEGKVRWAATHVSDVAKAYRLAIEKAEPGVRYHAIAEEGVLMREIAEALGRRLKIPTKSIPSQESEAHFGWMNGFVSLDLVGSSENTRKKLGWKPTGPSLIADLDKMTYAA